MVLNVFINQYMLILFRKLIEELLYYLLRLKFQGSELIILYFDIAKKRKSRS
jgi:hypothetical protein